MVRSSMIVLGSRVGNLSACDAGLKLLAIVHAHAIKLEIFPRSVYESKHRMHLEFGVLLVCVGSVLSLNNGLARTPPMGWLSWERYGCEIDCKTFPNQCISEKLYTSMADKLVELGLADLGYRYINIDDCWSTVSRPANGELVEDPARFPSGIPSLSKYVHSKGLKFGMYTDVGTKTCGGYPGLGGGNLHKDIAKFISWEIDSLKVDGCYADVKDMSRMYSELSELLNKSSRPIVYSCSWPAYQDDHCENLADMKTLQDRCNLWRNYDDIEDGWASVRSIVNFYARKSPDNIIVKAAGPGHWNDPDMLVAGNPGLSISEQRAQFAIWAILAAPLYISADLRTISDESLQVLKNEEVIAINQDPLGKQGYVLSDAGSYRVWVRQLTPHAGRDRIAVLFENKAEIFGPIRFRFNVSQLGWKNDGAYSVRDVHRHVDVPIETSNGGTFIVDVEESSVELFVFERTSSSEDDMDARVVLPEEDFGVLVEYE